MTVLNAKMSAQMKTKRILMQVLKEMMEVGNVPNVQLAELPTGSSPVANSAPTTSNVY
jgi:hypothetical protein